MSVKIFFCYAHKDKSLLDKLRTHLKPLQRQGLIDVWHDRDINAGREWEREISQQLNTAHIIILLVSPNFIDSDYCYSIEMRRAMQRHVRGEAHVIPIILRPVYWQGVLGMLQALPTDGKPVTSWSSRDAAFLDIVVNIMDIVNSLFTSSKTEKRIITSNLSGFPEQQNIKQTAADILKLLGTRGGEVLDERYQLLEPIGRGSMASVYRCRDLRMDRIVAIKVLREVYSTDPWFAIRFQREIKSVSVLQHPNLVQVFDYGQTDGNYFIVMELVAGTNLRSYLRSSSKLDIDSAIIIAHTVALALGEAHHHGIIHQNVKTENILLRSDGFIKLTDFGVVALYQDIRVERSTSDVLMRDALYHSPEQAQPESCMISPTIDVYALGIVLYEMLTGHTPFDGHTPVAVARQHIQDAPTPPSHFNRNLSPALEKIILRCLEKVPEMRFRDGSQLARALEMLGVSEIG